MDKDTLAQLVTFVTDTLMQGKDFVLAQAPEIVKEFLRWSIIQDVFWIGFGLVLIPLTILLYKACRKLNDYEGRLILSALDISVGGILSTVMILFHLFDLLEIWVAPKIYLIEYVTKLLKK